MYDSDDDTAFTDHLLDQFSAYYTITVVAVHLFMQWKAYHNQTQTQEFTASKAYNKMQHHDLFHGGCHIPAKGNKC